MKYPILAFALLLAVVATPAFAQKKSATAVNPTYTVDSKSSSMKWVGKKVTGQHNGTITIASGKVMTSGSTITGGSFAIDMKSIVCLDLTDAETNAKLVGHLKSDDFFGVEKFPTATFEIVSVKPLSKPQDNLTHTVTGKLTIKGITNTISFPAKLSMDGKHFNAWAKFMVDRAKYNVRYGSGSFFDNLGDKVIYDDFEIELDLKANV